MLFSCLLARQIIKMVNHFVCKQCHLSTVTIITFYQHVKMHRHLANSRFYCGLPSCPCSFQTLLAHASEAYTAKVFLSDLLCYLGDNHLSRCRSQSLTPKHTRLLALGKCNILSANGWWRNENILILCLRFTQLNTWYSH